MKPFEKPKMPSRKSKKPDSESRRTTRRIDELSVLIPNCRQKLQDTRRAVQASELTEPDPCESLRLAYLAALLTELVMELQLLQAQVATMAALDELTECEMANMPTPEEPPLPEAP